MEVGSASQQDKKERNRDESIGRLLQRSGNVLLESHQGY